MREIVYVLSKFPNLTDTFILNEILDLKQRGVNIKVLAVKKGKSSDAHDKTEGIAVEYFHKHWCFKNLQAQTYLIRRIKWGYFKVLGEAMYRNKHSLKKMLSNLNAFSIAGYFLFLLRDSDVKLFHAHFINFPSSIALYMSQLSGVPFSASAHANDIYKGDIPDITHKINKAKFFVTCTSANKQHLVGLGAKSDKIHHIYHGIDKEKWYFPRKPIKGKAFHIVSVARLVDKKGIVYLLEAIRALLNKNFDVRCSIVGDGPLFSELNNFVKQSKIDDFVTFYGALSHLEVKDIYQTCDCFVLPCRISSDGDRDGLPNVLLEAMSQCIPVITTPVSAIPELVENRVTGILVSENDSEAIVNAVIELINNPQLRQDLSENGRKVIEEKFNIQTSTSQLLSLFCNS